jgi:GT2 family glycosyltransferase
MKILFNIPTLFCNPAATQACIDSLVSSTMNIERDIVVVVNEMTDEFESWDPNHACVHKRCSHLKFNISKAMNTAIEMITDHDYFCFVDEGMKFKDGWLAEFIEIYNRYDNVGIIGVRGHSTFKHYHIKIDANLYQVLWSDGLMFMRPDRIKRIGNFDEKYFADCETQDYCYKLIDAGYVNLYFDSNKVHHQLYSSGEKVSGPDLIALESLTRRSRQIFMSRWGSWREMRYNK